MKKHWKIIVPITVVLLIIIAGGFVYWRYTQDTFNNSVRTLHTQFDQSTANYTKISAAVDDMGAYVSSATNSLESPSTITTQLDTKLKTLKKSIDTACHQKDSDITDITIGKDVPSLLLTSDQKQYIQGMKESLKDFASTEYSNTGACADGTLLYALDENLAATIPGMVTLGQIAAADTFPTADQLATLKTYTTISSLKDEAILQKNFPDSTTYLNTINAYLANTYYTYNAYQNNRSDDVTKYGNELTKLSTAYTSDNKKSQKETTNFSMKSNKQTVIAANKQIQLIQDMHNKKASFAAQLDYTNPVFWLVSAKVDLSSEKNSNQSYPAASNIDTLVKILKDGDLNKLHDAHLLGSVAYTSLGSDNSGRSITTTQANGNVLIDKHSAAN